MQLGYLRCICLAAAATISAAVLAGPKPDQGFEWTTVVNNNDLIPPLYLRTFNSYNQPSVNRQGLVVMRARSRGGPPLGPATHGIYARDMAEPDAGIVYVLDRATRVPYPNNLDATFVETPSFPRIDADGTTIATRGNHSPVHRYRLADGSETRAGTTGIYTNPFGDLITGAANLGEVPELSFFGVPELNDTRFEVFPGAPAVTHGDTIVFKGNYTLGGIGRTGVYFRILGPQAGGGDWPANLIANTTDTLIPGTQTVFGSTAPPSAASGMAVFAGFDDEHAPTLGGIYAAPLEAPPRLTTLVGIGERVPGVTAARTFTNLGEGVAFDGRFVGFWGAWGTETKTTRLYCPTEGNKDRIAYCNQQLVCGDTGELRGDPNSTCDAAAGRCYTEREVPVNQGIFVHDLTTGLTSLVARTGSRFDAFLFWNYSGKVPCKGTGHSGEGETDDGEAIRWRSTAFVAVSARRGATFNAAFKARSFDAEDGVGIDGIYLQRGPGRAPVSTVIDTRMDGLSVDPEAPAGSRVATVGIEREGLRGSWLVVNAGMAVPGSDEEDGMAGVYVTRVDVD